MNLGISPAVLVLGGAVAVAALLRPLWGIYLMVALGLVQDVLRKAHPLQPAALSLLALVPFLFVYGGECLRGRRPRMAPLWRRRDALATPLALFVIWVLLASVVGYANMESIPLTILGLMTWLLPVATLQLGLRLGASRQRVKRVLLLYLVVAGIGCSGVVLATLGYDSPLLEQMRGEVLQTYAPGAGALDLQTGFYRAPEIVGWHAAMGLALALLFLQPGWRKSFYVPVLGLAIALFGYAILLSGRRKYILLVCAIFVVQSAVAMYFRRAAGGTVRFLGVLAVLSVFALWIASPTVLGGTDAGAHLSRVRGLETETGGRFDALVLSAPAAVVERTGLLGAGAGSSAQGARFVGGGDAGGWAAEGGVGHLVAELGIPGLLLAIALLVAYGRHIAGALRKLVVVDMPAFRYVCWGAAVIAAHASTYAGAKQAYGDPFILCWLGLLGGMLLSAEAWRSREPAAAPEPSQERASRVPLRVRVSASGAK